MAAGPTRTKGTPGHVVKTRKLLRDLYGFRVAKYSWHYSDRELYGIQAFVLFPVRPTCPALKSDPLVFLYDEEDIDIGDWVEVINLKIQGKHEHPPWVHKYFNNLLTSPHLWGKGSPFYRFHTNRFRRTAKPELGEEIPEEVQVYLKDYKRAAKGVYIVNLKPFGVDIFFSRNKEDYKNFVSKFFDTCECATINNMMGASGIAQQFELEDGGSVFGIWAADEEYDEYLWHEALHITIFVLDYFGVKCDPYNHEIYCYTQGFLVNTMKQAFAEEIEKEKKNKVQRNSKRVRKVRNDTKKPKPERDPRIDPEASDKGD